MIFVAAFVVICIVGGRYFNKLGRDSKEIAIFDYAQQFIVSDGEFSEKYGKPISVVLDENKGIQWVEDKECVIYCVVKTDTRMLYLVKLHLDYKGGSRVFNYDSVDIMKSAF